MTHRPGRALIVGIALASSALLAAAASAQWLTRDVDSPRKITAGSSLVFDAMDQPMVAYAGDSVYLVRWVGTRWVRETIDATGCGFWNPSLALDAAGVPAVSYGTEASGALKLARWDGTVWTIETLDAGPVASTSSLAFDRLGRPSVAYMGPGSVLKYTKWNGSSWDIETVDGGLNVGRSPSLVFLSTGMPAISYHDIENGDLKYASWNGTAWVLTVVDAGGMVGLYTSMRLDPVGNPAISYYDQSTADLRFARWDGAIWVRQVVDSTGDVGKYNSLAFDGAGQPTIAYSDETNGDLKLAKWTGARWEVETVDAPGQVGWYTSLAFDGTDRPAISYTTAYVPPFAPSLDLKVARWTGTTWTTESLDEGGSVGYWSSMVLDGSGFPSIAYHDLVHDDLKYARWNGFTWAVETVDAAGEVGGFSSLALDSLGRPAISYYDSTNADLKYARWNGTAWDIQVVDSVGDVGEFSSLALDAMGHPAIAYRLRVDANLGMLKYARWDGAAWNIETVDTCHIYGISLVLDSTGVPSVAYLEHRLSGDLMYTTWDGTAWTRSAIERVGSFTAVRNVSVALDGAGTPSVSYVLSIGLRYAKWNGSSWDLETAFRASGGVLRGASLALDSAGKPMIASKHFWTASLQFVRWTGTAWTVEVVDDSGRAGDTPSLAIDDQDRPLISYYTECAGSLRLASPALPALLYRGVVTNLALGWRASALPLTDANDDPTSPFPFDTWLGRNAQDTIGAAVPLTLYRLLVDGTTEAGNVLRAAKAPIPSTVALTY